MVVVRLLGPVEVIDGSGDLNPIGSALRRTVLALMALRAGEVVTADWLLEQAWGGEPPESGLRALRFHISRLRKELGGADGIIETRPGGYRLAVSADQVDVLAIEGAAEAARRERDPNLAAEMYTEALAMWRGQPFADTAPCSTLDDEAGRLDALRLTIIEDRFRARLDAGGGRELVADLSRATSQQPLRESLWSMLIIAQYRAGLQADALRSYEQMRAMLVDTLGLDPSSELQDLQRRVLQHDPSLGEMAAGVRGGSASAGQRSQGNLPISARPLIDSDDQVGRVRKQLHDHRLITLTGTGGVGKSRLAVELGWSCLDEFNAGVWLVELAPVADPDAVDAAVASTLQIRAQPGATLVESIVDWFTGRELLLVVDNCEHLLDPIRRLINVVLARCPTVKVVATSREPLGAAGEHVHPVNVLNPAGDGVALFLDRAVAADSSFVMSDLERGVVAEICRRLDGLPLAIELAAARVRSMAPVDLLARLDDRFRLLRGVARDGVDHHETLLATVEWSYRLLSDKDHLVFDRLSVFAGGFDLRAAESVCSVDAIDEPGVVESLTTLVDKSMVVAERSPEGTRYGIHETLRQFGESHLRGDCAAALRDRHLRHYVNVAEEADTLFRGARQVAGAAIFDREWDNLRRAHDWAIATADLVMAERLIYALELYAQRRLRFELGDWVERTIALGSDQHQPSPDTFAHGAFWAFNVEDEERGLELLDQGIGLLAAIDDPGALSCVGASEFHRHPRIPDHFRTLEVISTKLDLDRDWMVLITLADEFLFRQPRPETDHLARLVEAAERIRAPQLMVAAALEVGKSSMLQDPPDFAAGLLLYGPALVTARESGDLVSECDCLRAIALATVALHPDKAIQACRDALTRLFEIRFWWRTWHVFDSIGLALVSSGRTEPAAVVVGHLEAHHPPFGMEDDLGFRARTLDIVRSHKWCEEWMARGAAMDRYQIVEYALAAVAP